MKAERDKRAAVSEAIATGNVQAINYFIAQRYVEALAKIGTAENQKTLILPLEATDIMGSLAGITEIAKQAFGHK